MNDDKCVVDKKETTLNSVLTELEAAIAVAGRNADNTPQKRKIAWN